MKACPFCAEQIQDEAIKCRYCGEFLDGRQGSRQAAGPQGFYWGYEYRSQREFFGLPLVHITRGIDPRTGLPRVAKGIIAIGNIAIGGIAIGGLAMGGFAFGGLGLGLIVFGGVAIGGIALGGLALALYLAIGGAAISASYAIGGFALAPYAIDGTGADSEFVRQLERLWPGIRRVFPDAGH